ncbi:EscU/YscU/HrcU family type III secretion system export apparatus switch protein [Shouchella clausii]|uniref:EscU/YscU/HrcU family type III secretion system export apparatus switch protein n=1 Tax=Shouchella clausii TaxID=79880 RepID=UPI00280AC18E|nr:EscU/YscU/HrcU family type III secretion system export apparatus switch protein [Shouchella clausii]WMM31614.1 EscU/YscU/HrcU family type III secretion system export apparatus switch protein [Shouchella clausii]
MKQKRMKRAYALSYKDGDVAPRLVAKGARKQAEAMVAEAKKQGIPVIKHQQLSEELAHLREMQFIPESLYEVAAELFVFLHSLDSVHDFSGSAHTKTEKGGKEMDEKRKIGEEEFSDEFGQHRPALEKDMIAKGLKALFSKKNKPRQESAEPQEEKQKDKK